MLTLDAQAFYLDVVLLLHQQVEEMEPHFQVEAHLEILELPADLVVEEDGHQALILLLVELGEPETHLLHLQV
jgi:hypothetical protein